MASLDTQEGRDQQQEASASQSLDTSVGQELTQEDLERTAREYAQYLVVNCQQEKQQLDERIQSIVVRVEEFQQQLDWMHQNMTSTSEKMSELYTKTQQLQHLFNRINQVEDFVQMVGRQVDKLEESVAQAEKELEPSKLRKVFSVIPGWRKPLPKEPTDSWKPPEVLSCKDYFSPQLRSIEPS